MIDPKEHIEKELDEKVIFVTSYDHAEDKIYYLVITKEGTKYTASINTDPAYSWDDIPYRVEEAAGILVIEIKRDRALAKAREELKQAQKTVASLEGKLFE